MKDSTVTVLRMNTQWNSS